MNYINYFNNLTDFKSKKEILEDIESIYDKKINDIEYKELIKYLLENNIIDKSSNSGNCKYISVKFLKLQQCHTGKDYFEKNNNDNNLQKKLNIKFNFNDCIIEKILNEMING